MKKVNLKYAIFFFAVSLLMSCKKDTKIDVSKYTYTDDNITPIQIADNYQMIVDGVFSMSNSGLYGSIGVSRNLPDFKYLRTSHVLINDKKFIENISIPALNEFRYYYPLPESTPTESQRIQAQFAAIYTQPKTNFQLYDTTNNFIVGFIFSNPKSSSITIDNQNYREAPTGSRIVVHWDADPSNKLGVAITLSGNNGIRYLNFPETGSADVTDEALAVGGIDRISLTFSRGIILTGKGADGRLYKLTSAASKTEIIYI